MAETDDNDLLLKLEAERLRLERESIAVERERLEAARNRVAEAAKVEVAKHNPWWALISALLFASLTFALGVFYGYSAADSREQERRSARLREALSQLEHNLPSAENDSKVKISEGTNNVPKMKAHGNVSVMVIQ